MQKAEAKELNVESARLFAERASAGPVDQPVIDFSANLQDAVSADSPTEENN